eukprot:g6323.t1
MPPLLYSTGELRSHRTPRELRSQLSSNWGREPRPPPDKFADAFAGSSHLNEAGMVLMLALTGASVVVCPAVEVALTVDAAAPLASALAGEASALYTTGEFSMSAGELLALGKDSALMQSAVRLTVGDDAIRAGKWATGKVSDALARRLLPTGERSAKEAAEGEHAGKALDHDSRATPAARAEQVAALERELSELHRTIEWATAGNLQDGITADEAKQELSKGLPDMVTDVGKAIHDIGSRASDEKEVLKAGLEGAEGLSDGMDKLNRWVGEHLNPLRSEVSDLQEEAVAEKFFGANAITREQLIDRLKETYNDLRDVLEREKLGLEKNTDKSFAKAEDHLQAQYAKMEAEVHEGFEKGQVDSKVESQTLEKLSKGMNEKARSLAEQHTEHLKDIARHEKDEKAALRHEYKDAEAAAGEQWERAEKDVAARAEVVTEEVANSVEQAAVGMLVKTILGKAVHLLAKVVKFGVHLAWEAVKFIWRMFARAIGYVMRRIFALLGRSVLGKKAVIEKRPHDEKLTEQREVLDGSPASSASAQRSGSAETPRKPDLAAGDLLFLLQARLAFDEKVEKELVGSHALWNNFKQASESLERELALRGDTAGEVFLKTQEDHWLVPALSGLHLVETSSEQRVAEGACAELEYNYKYNPNRPAASMRTAQEEHVVVVFQRRGDALVAALDAALTGFDQKVNGEGLQAPTKRWISWMMSEKKKIAQSDQERERDQAVRLQAAFSQTCGYQSTWRQVPVPHAEPERERTAENSAGGLSEDDDEKSLLGDKSINGYNRNQGIEFHLWKNHWAAGQVERSTQQEGERDVEPPGVLKTTASAPTATAALEKLEKSWKEFAENDWFSDVAFGSYVLSDFCRDVQNFEQSSASLDGSPLQGCCNLAAAATATTGEGGREGGATFEVVEKEVLVALDLLDLNYLQGIKGKIQTTDETTEAEAGQSQFVAGVGARARAGYVVTEITDHDQRRTRPDALQPGDRIEALPSYYFDVLCRVALRMIPACPESPAQPPPYNFWFCKGAGHFSTRQKKKELNEFAALQEAHRLYAQCAANSLKKLGANRELAAPRPGAANSLWVEFRVWRKFEEAVDAASAYRQNKCELAFAGFRREAENAFANTPCVHEDVLVRSATRRRPSSSGSTSELEQNANDHGVALAPHVVHTYCRWRRLQQFGKLATYASASWLLRRAAETGSSSSRALQLLTGADSSLLQEAARPGDASRTSKQKARLELTLLSAYHSQVVHDFSTTTLRLQHEEKVSRLLLTLDAAEKLMEQHYGLLYRGHRGPKAKEVAGVRLQLATAYSQPLVHGLGFLELTLGHVQVRALLRELRQLEQVAQTTATSGARWSSWAWSSRTKIAPGPAPGDTLTPDQEELLQRAETVVPKKALTWLPVARSSRETPTQEDEATRDRTLHMRRNTGSLFDNGSRKNSRDGDPPVDPVNAVDLDGETEEGAAWFLGAVSGELKFWTQRNAKYEQPKAFYDMRRRLFGARLSEEPLLGAELRALLAPDGSGWELREAVKSPAGYKLFSLAHALQGRRLRSRLGAQIDALVAKQQRLTAGVRALEKTKFGPRAAAKEIVPTVLHVPLDSKTTPFLKNLASYASIELALHQVAVVPAGKEMKNDNISGAEQAALFDSCKNDASSGSVSPRCQMRRYLWHVLQRLKVGAQMQLKPDLASPFDAELLTTVMEGLALEVGAATEIDNGKGWLSQRRRWRDLLKRVGDFMARFLYPVVLCAVRTRRQEGGDTDPDGAVRTDPFAQDQKQQYNYYLSHTRLRAAAHEAVLAVEKQNLQRVKIIRAAEVLPPRPGGPEGTEADRAGRRDQAQQERFHRLQEGEILEELLEPLHAVFLWRDGVGAANRFWLDKDVYPALKEVQVESKGTSSPTGADADHTRKAETQRTKLVLGGTSQKQKEEEKEFFDVLREFHNKNLGANSECGAEQIKKGETMKTDAISTLPLVEEDPQQKTRDEELELTQLNKRLDFRTKKMVTYSSKKCIVRRIF